MDIEKKSNGALIGLTIIIIILIIGGVYLWMSGKNTVLTPVTSQTVTNQDSTDLNTLEASLQATDTTTGVDVNAVK